MPPGRKNYAPHRDIWAEIFSSAPSLGIEKAHSHRYCEIYAGHVNDRKRFTEAIVAKANKSDAVEFEELLISSLATADALSKLLIEKGLITAEELMQKLAAERATYQLLLRGPRDS